MISKLLRRYQVPNPRTMFIEMLALKLAEMPPWDHLGKPYGYHVIIIPTRTERTIALAVDLYDGLRDTIKAHVVKIEGGLELSYWEKRKLGKAATLYANRSYRHYQLSQETTKMEDAIDGIEALIGPPVSEKDLLN